MKLTKKAGATSEIWQIFVQDSSSTTGAGLTGLTNSSASLTAYYHRENDTTATAISLVTMTVGTFTSSGFKEIDATNLPGWYQFCPPNAALASGAKSCGFHLKGAANMAPLAIECQLSSYDPDDAVHLGLTCLPNTAVTTNGSLLTSGTGTDQLSVSGGSGKATLSDAVSHGGTLGSSTATLAMSRVNIASQTSNTVGLTIAGNGTGAGSTVTGGATGIGLSIVGGGTSGDGVSISTTSGHGVNIAPIGSSKHGLLITGGNGGTSDGLKLAAGTGGVGFRLDTLTASGAVTLSSTLTVSGTTSLAAFSTSGTTTLNALTVTNATTLSGAVSLGSTLSVTGTTTLAALSMTTLTASGAVAFQSTLAVTGTTTLTGAVSLGSTLGITGLATFSDGIQVDRSTTNGIGLKITGNAGGEAVKLIAGTGDAVTITSTGSGKNAIKLNSGSGGYGLVSATGFSLNIHGNVNGALDNQRRISTGTLISATSTTVTLDAALQADNRAVGGTIDIVSGTGQYQTRVIIGYVDSTQVITVDRAFDVTPDATSAYNIYFGDSPKLDSNLKIQGVVLTDTLTTYTGNTVQTGDSFARIGLAGVGLTNLGDTRIANLDATVSSRVSTTHFDTIIGTPAVSVSADLAEIEAETDGIASIPTSNPSAAAITTAVWTALLASSDFSTAASIGKLLKDDIDAAISSRSTYAGADTSGTTTLLARIDSAITISGGKVAATVASGDDADAASIKSTIGVAGVGLTNLGDARLANLDVASSTLSTATNLAEANADLDELIVTVGALNNISATDVWAAATRTLTAGTNIVLAKGTGVTGLNDITVAAVASQITTDHGSGSYQTATGFSTFDPMSDVVAHVTLVDTVGNAVTIGDVTLAASQPHYAPAKAADAMTLTAAYDSAKTAASVTSIFAQLVESGVTFQQLCEALGATLAGKRSNAGTPTEQFDAIGNPGTARVVSNLDASGNGTPTLTL